MGEKFPDFRTFSSLSQTTEQVPLFLSNFICFISLLAFFFCSYFGGKTIRASLSFALGFISSHGRMLFLPGSLPSPVWVGNNLSCDEVFSFWTRNRFFVRIMCGVAVAGCLSPRLSSTVWKAAYNFLVSNNYSFLKIYFSPSGNCWWFHCVSQTTCFLLFVPSRKAAFLNSIVSRIRSCPDCKESKGSLF